MYFSINLATRTYLDRRLVNRIGAGVCGVLLIMLAWNINRTAWSVGELHRLRNDIVSYENRLNSRPHGVSEKEYTRLLGSIKFYNEIIGRKSYNWMGLLEQLELVTPEGVTLAALNPEMKSGEIKIEGHARSFAQIKQYMEKLEDSRVFTSILLLSHTSVAVSERDKSVNFSISFKAAPQ